MGEAHKTVNRHSGLLCLFLQEFTFHDKMKKNGSTNLNFSD